jgi:hypothetical protein
MADIFDTKITYNRVRCKKVRYLSGFSSGAASWCDLPDVQSILRRLKYKLKGAGELRRGNAGVREMC